MTAGTLSTVPNWQNLAGGEHGRRRGAIAATAGGRSARLNPDSVYAIPVAAAAPATVPAPAMPPQHAAAPRPEAQRSESPRTPPSHCGATPAGADLDRMEYEARGLLNLVAFATRCLERGGNAADAEKKRWRQEIDAAGRQLEALYEAGLSREFLSARPRAGQDRPTWRNVGR